MYYEYIGQYCVSRSCYHQFRLHEFIISLHMRPLKLSSPCLFTQLTRLLYTFTGSALALMILPTFPFSRLPLPLRR